MNHYIGQKPLKYSKNKKICTSKKQKTFINCTMLMLVFYIFLYLSPVSAIADESIIYERISESTVSSGVIHRHIQRFLPEGWLDIHVLEVDLTNPYVKVDVLINSLGLQNLADVKTLANDAGAIAAVNGDFFTWFPYDAKKGHAAGVIVDEGELISTTPFFNGWGDSLATFSLDKDNNPAYGYWKSDLAITAPDGSSATITWFNKYSTRDFTDISLYTSIWGEKSIGATEAYPDMVEMVVIDDHVAEIRQGQPPVAIPENGYIVCGRQEGGLFLTEHFNAGDKVQVTMATFPDWSEVQTAVSGGAILVKDGKIPTFSHNVSGKNPRTAAGTSADGKTLYLVTVDGRQNTSMGMTQTELANLMLELGAANALNLDGGGSTTFTARYPGEDMVRVMNSPSDGNPRKVANAIGIISTSSAAELDRIEIVCPDTNIFVGTSRSLAVRGYSPGGQLLELDPSLIQWSVSGIEGTFSGSSFTPTSVGEGKIKASYGNLTYTLNISALSKPRQLIIAAGKYRHPEDLSDSERSRVMSAGDGLGEAVTKLNSPENKTFIESGKTKEFSVWGKNKNGFYGLIEAGNLNINLTPDAGTVQVGYTGSLPALVFETDSGLLLKGGTGFKVTGTGASGILTVSLDDVTAHLPINSEDTGSDLPYSGYDPDFPEGSFTFAIYSQSRDPLILLEKLTLGTYVGKAVKGGELRVVIGQGSFTSKSQLKDKGLFTDSSMKEVQYDNNVFLTLDTSMGGIRTSDPSQWKWLLDRLKQASANNIFILLNDSLSEFSDTMEADLFRRILTDYRLNTGKNIYVISTGLSDYAALEEGVHYITIRGIPDEKMTIEDAYGSNYLEVSVSGRNVNYRFRSIFDVGSDLGISDHESAHEGSLN